MRSQIRSRRPRPSRRDICLFGLHRRDRRIDKIRLRHLRSDLACELNIARRRFRHPEAFERKQPHSVILDRLDELERVFVVVDLDAFLSDRDDQLVASERVIDRVRELGGKIDVPAIKVNGHDRRHRFGLAVGRVNAFADERGRGEKVELGFIARDKI
ncbi:MAG: hypothetical protein UZ17_ACD001000771 [Acidobacteria bacterium OLB17]|nr:MAG: hypothetical protein UZ17_ACD001000771 [Acidobacteria bacterium OLB17]